MSCAHRRNKIMRDLARVRILAQAAADLVNAEQKIYKTICDGVQVYKFSSDWEGATVETVRPNRQDTSESILQNSEHSGLESTESDRSENISEETEWHMGQSDRHLLPEEQSEGVQEFPKRRKGKRRSSE